jgi:succinoglycan biosynthesis transport protein ExoP
LSLTQRLGKRGRFAKVSIKEQIMANPQTPGTPGPSGGLPFEPLTLLIGLLRRWKIFAIFFILSIPLGAFAGLTFGTRIWEAETVMLYNPKDMGEDSVLRSPPLETQIHMVKIPSNLEKVREKLQLPTSLKALARACQVYVQRKTSLFFIRTKWDNAEKVAAIANTLRDVFLEHQLQLLKAAAASELRGLEFRFKNVTNQLKKADQKLQQFISKNKIVDLDLEIKWNLEQLTSLELLLSNARVDKETLELQKASLEEKIRVMMAETAKETAAAAQTRGLGDLNIRIERLRRAISDDRVQRGDIADLTKYEQAFKRAEKLYEKGLISKAEYEENRANYEKAQVNALDTEQITEWKKQLKLLEQQVIPEKGSFTTQAGSMLQNLQLKALSMELEGVSLTQKLSHLDQERKKVKGRLGILTDLQRQYSEFTREVTARETEKKGLEKMLAKVRRAYESDTPDFTVISPAQVPLFRYKSNRKLIAVVVVFLVNMIGLTLILGLELFDTTIKSAAELSQKFSLPVIGVLSHIKDANKLFPTESEFPLIEPFRIISRRIRHDVPMNGTRIMVVSAEPGEGKTMVAANLAAVFGRQDERVLLVDTQVRAEESEYDLRYLISEKDKPLIGLGEYLSFQAENVRDVTWPTVLPGVECVPHVEEAVIPDLLASNRMREMLEETSKSFSMIIMDGPTTNPYVDAELVAELSDAILFVVRSRTYPSSLLKKEIERIKGSGTPIIGFILNDVDKLYLNRV